jgi:glycosyltransferase involved in cell wall biosynthesis
MKKILIIAYRFPPSNHTSSERTYSWARYFKEAGYYPVVITRNWDIDPKIEKHDIKPVGQTAKVVKEGDYEVHYLPFEPDISLRFFDKYAGTKLHILYKIVLFIYSLLEPFFVFSLSKCYNGFYQKAKSMIEKDKDIGNCIISTPPFIMYKIGYRLKKKFKQVSFIADYRDDWGTNEVFMNPNNKFLPGLLQKYAGYFERKWMKSYTFFLSVSQNYVEKIEAFIKRPGYLLENGFMGENYLDNNVVIDKDNFTITYVGSLLQTQPIEIFINAVKRVIESNKNIKVQFVGGKNNYDSRIMPLIEGFESNFIFYPRISKGECIKLQMASDLLLLVSHNALKGTPGSKMYEYLALRKPVLVCPTDNDIMEETLTASGQGIFVNNEEESYVALVNMMRKFERKELLVANVNTRYIDSFDRRNLTQKLAGFIDAHKQE